MKKSLLPALISAVALNLVLTGCVERRVVYVQSPPPVVAPPQVVVTAPPAPPQERIVVSPGPQYVWQPGHWAWQGRWVWLRGVWVIRPHPRAAWVPGHWVHRSHGYVWINGYWH